jgi:ABC-type spermidine/putrescine transport system permease subunit I
MVLVLPGAALLTMFLFYPLVDVGIRSVVDPTFTTKNYEWFFTTDVNVAVMRRTFGTAALVTLVCLLISYPYAYLMTIVGSRMRALMFMVVLIPLWTSLMIRTLAWVVLLQDTGLINDALEAVGLSRLEDRSATASRCGKYGRPPRYRISHGLPPTVPPGDLRRVPYSIRSGIGFLHYSVTTWVA